MVIHHIELMEDNIDIFHDLMDNTTLCIEWLYVNKEFLYGDKLKNLIIHFRKNIYNP